MVDVQFEEESPDRINVEEFLNDDVKNRLIENLKEAGYVPELSREQVETRRRNKSIMENLAELGGGHFRPEDDILSEGKKLVLPQGMSMSRAVKVLQDRIKADEEVTRFSRNFKYRPWDGAVCTWRALKNVFGLVSGKTTFSFFGPNPPEFRDIPVSATETESVPWGAFTVAAFENTTFFTGAQVDDDLGMLFQLRIDAPRRYRAQIEGIFTLVQTELEERSIYRGKAFDGQEQPEFLDLTGVSPDKVVYSEETIRQLEANIWSVLRYRDALRDANISRKRAALLFGPYGTGKTLAGFLTAQQAVEHGWTFLYARPGKDDVTQVLQTARLYQPACVFFEDLDSVADAEETQDKATKLLDAFDGITAKGTELMVVLTTNHPDRIHKGMLRPGRLDAVIEIGALDESGIAKLMTVVLPENTIDTENIEWPRVADAAKDMLPAYVKEAADRAYRYALARDGDPTNIWLTTEDLVDAAEGLRPQLKLMDEANDTPANDSLGDLVRYHVQRAIVDVYEDPADWGISREAVAEHRS